MEGDEEEGGTGGEGFTMPAADVLRKAREIAERYEVRPTLRQLYYRFVAGGLCPSDPKAYRRIGEILSKARLEGRFPFDLLMDRTRSAHVGRFGESKMDLDRAEQVAAAWVKFFPDQLIWLSRWFGQPRYVSVWVEKEALAGVFEDLCIELGVSWFVCRGYPSVSALAEWVDGVNKAQNARRRASREGYARGSTSFQNIDVLYFGDHDPDGWEIPRAALRNLNRIVDVKGYVLPPIRFHRVALNMDQIERYDPPPFEAKVSSSRCAGYVREHDTTDAWELDALDPDVLQSLIREHVDELFDQSIYDSNLEAVVGARDELWARLVSGEFSQRALASGRNVEDPETTDGGTGDDTFT